MPSPVNAFTPASEVTDPGRFAGRAPELQSLSRALQSDGVQIVIYGNRGVGKSSIAHQIDLLARGKAEVMERLNDPPEDPFDYLTIYFQCDDSIESFPQLLLRLLSDEEALAAWVPFRVAERKTSLKGGGHLGVRVISISGSSTESLVERAEELETDIVSVFHNVIGRILETGIARDGILLIVDEFDRIKDRRGLASILKVLASKAVKFALVGVATTVQELILEHESVARQLADGTVHVPPMSKEEMEEIFTRAETYLDGNYSFDRGARDWIIEISRGHPFYVHLVGKHALLRTIDIERKTVTVEIAQEALAEIALKGSAPVQESLYKTAIGHSYIREVVLKGFAKIEEHEIHTTELYARLARELKVEPAAISVYVGHLASEKYGEVLEKTRDRYYRFTDSLFKAYAAARPHQLTPSDQE